jgi:hypothetical protein
VRKRRIKYTFECGLPVEKRQQDDDGATVGQKTARNGRRSLEMREMIETRVDMITREDTSRRWSKSGIYFNCLMRSLPSRANFFTTSSSESCSGCSLACERRRDEKQMSDGIESE